MPPRCCGQVVLPTDAVWDPREHPALRLLNPAALASWEEAVRRAQAVAVADVDTGFVDRAVIQMALNSNERETMSQFCPGCHRLVGRSEGCNHMT
jgi:hypothetical protein